MRTYDLTNARWSKSSYSNGQGGECVEVARNVPDIVPVRDSKQAEGPVLLFAAASWTAFLSETRTSHP
ncbi:DUF397 domain-containing protein [Streptomyces sp. B-S-A8]|uniref:DUF397 domain-containing protein n=1 Tax=Streptomyces solicavernae TaxID=3043614 RepID=A0ABT6S0N7_9ACTN|nr:DUF397 domain-containing protein [Streptomyces sp. B-S-A8]MDI3390260.1 DUF397 domain-containing protein [Streptomyces sp. B-S-A8]